MDNQATLFNAKSVQEPRRGKHGPREWYMNFGGWFSHPQEDIDTFVRLPRWRQKEILTTQAAFKKDPTLRAFAIHDIRTGEIPGQNVYEAPEGLYLKHEGPPASVKYDIPDGITLTAAKKFGGRKLRNEAELMTPEERRELGYLF
jgi:hypothetical protein